LCPANAISVLTAMPSSAKFVCPVRQPVCYLAPLMPAPLPFTMYVSVFALKPSLCCLALCVTLNAKQN